MKVKMIADYSFMYDDIYIYPQSLGQDIEELVKDEEFRKKILLVQLLPW